MALKSEWKRRLEMWRKELPKHFYTPLGSVAVEGFVTLDRLKPEQAKKHAFAPMPVGTPWGAKWEYGWFRGQFTLPKEAADAFRAALAAAPDNPDALWFLGLNAAADGHPAEARALWQKLLPQLDPTSPDYAHVKERLDGLK